MRRASMPLAATTLAVALSAGTALTVTRIGDPGPNGLVGFAGGDAFPRSR